VQYPVDRDVLVVDGPDATTFLDGQLSQDLATIGDGASAWTFALDPTGKVGSWFRISRADDGWLLDVDAGQGTALEARLGRFLLRTDASFELLDWTMVSIRGPGAADVDAGGARSLDPAWPGVEGLDLLGPAVDAPAELPVGRLSDLEALRIEAGVPAMGAELDDTVIPAASGVVERSVSFTKGCFTGQELVARIDSRGGSTPTRLMGLVVDGPAVPERGAPVVVDGSEVGRVTSVAWAPWRDAAVAMGFIARAVESAAEGSVTGPESPLPAQLHDLPMGPP